MRAAITSVPDVFDAREVARAARVRPAAVRALLADGTVHPVGPGYLSLIDAVRAVRILAPRGAIPGAHALFTPPQRAERSPVRALAASGALHVIAFVALAFLTSLKVATAPHESATPVRLVFLATPGPGGGGGGGGLRQSAPPTRAELKGASALRSPVTPPVVHRPDPQPQRRPKPVAVRPETVEPPAPPPPAPPEPMPEIVAPVATAPADARDTPGTIPDPVNDTGNRGSGSGGGAGTGTGTGSGEGQGAGIGAGSGGGTGGGPYRPGSGITPPAIEREVKPDYTEEARRRGVAGDVVLEIVVRSNGSVGDVKVLQGLPGGLNERAIDAVRQWRFSPARRFGTPVDVIVEVAVEFKLR
jgi:protein TonB